MSKETKTVHLDPQQLVQLKRKAINENSTVKHLVKEAIAKSLAPKTYTSTEGY